MLPVLLAVLVSNAVAQMFTPSLYESIIILKKLPHLPDLNSHKIYNVSGNLYQWIISILSKFLVDKFMNKDVTMIDVNADARRIRELLGNFKYSVFPLVDSSTNRILIGSITRTEMSRSIEMSMTRPLESASVNPGLNKKYELYIRLYYIIRMYDNYKIRFEIRIFSKSIDIQYKHQQWYQIKLVCIDCTQCFRYYL